MFAFLKRLLAKLRRPETTGNRPVLEDLDQRPLAPGDRVKSLRYDLGVCQVVTTEKGLTYRSEEDGREVSWHLMVDASTDRQKVRKIIDAENQNTEPDQFATRYFTTS